CCTLAELPEELEELVIRRRQLGRDRVPGAAQVQRHVEQASDQVVCGLLQRVTIAVSQAGERETTAVCLLGEVERWNPWFSHARIVLRGSEGKFGAGPLTAGGPG